jgi:hypothetical protein
MLGRHETLTTFQGDERLEIEQKGNGRMSKQKQVVQSDVLESLASYIKRVEKYAPELAKKKLIVSTDFDVEPFKEDRGIRKTPVVWPLWDYKMFYVVDVPPGVTVPKHSHNESVFRILISGSLTINGVKIEKPGTWYVVPAFTEYKIKTETGYSVLSDYTSVCRTGKQQALREKLSAPRS